MRLGPQVWLESSSFPKIPGEEEETNPGVFGKAFAEWVASRLKETSEPCEEVIPEDWGWCVIIHYRPYMLFVACRCGEGEHPSEPKLNEWAATVIAEPGLIQRLLRRVDPAPDVERFSAWLERELPNAPGAVRVWVERNAT